VRIPIQTWQERKPDVRSGIGHWLKSLDGEARVAGCTGRHATPEADYADEHALATTAT
jgi:hypothetical protein